MKLRLPVLAFLFGCAFASSAVAKVAVGESAPDFSLGDANGARHALSQYRGKVVVLEWNNPECPFVGKHYGSGNMQAQQAEARADGVVWLTINSGADGKQGHLDAAAAQAYVAKVGGKQAAYLLDTDGTVGKLYGARTTPHMYVIDALGVLRYMGGIDSVPSTDQGDIARATQYVRQALGEIKAGKAVGAPVSQPYGCSVKYRS